MMISQPICLECKHFDIDTFSCAAFDKIPEIILLGDNDHKKPLPDQTNDIVFEEKE